jgi:hypothetical protein
VDTLAKLPKLSYLALLQDPFVPHPCPSLVRLTSLNTLLYGDISAPVSYREDYFSCLPRSLTSLGLIAPLDGVVDRYTFTFLSTTLTRLQNVLFHNFDPDILSKIGCLSTLTTLHRLSITMQPEQIEKWRKMKRTATSKTILPLSYFSSLVGLTELQISAPNVRYHHSDLLSLTTLKKLRYLEINGVSVEPSRLSLQKETK